MKTVRHLNGYVVVYDPTNKNSMTSENWSGWIYLHRKVCEESIGRTLLKNEIVHHKDGDKRNNDITNLEVMLRSEHCRHHSIIPKTICICGLPIRVKKYKYCSLKCKVKNTTKFPGVDNLQVLMDTHHTYSSVAKVLLVSDKTIKQWCVKWNIVTNN